MFVGIATGIFLRGAGPGYGDDFVMTVRTTAAAETLTLPCGAGTYNAMIDWGDNTAPSAITSNIDADLAHVYATAGDYTVRISGTFPYLVFNNAGDRLKILTVEQMGRVGWTSLVSSFFGCSNMTKFIAGNTDFAGAKSFSNTWQSCTALTTLNITSLATNVTQIISMSNSLFGATALTALNLSGFDFSQCTTIAGAFRGMTALVTLTLPDNAVTTLCTTISSAFFSCGALETFNTTGWDTSAVTDFTNTLRDMGTLNIDISHWRFAAVAPAITLFASGTILATAQYDAALIEWAGADMTDSISLDMGTSKYTGGGAAAAARADLIATDLWVITDGGIA